MKAVADQQFIFQKFRSACVQ